MIQGNKDTERNIKRKMRRSPKFNTAVYWLCGRFQSKGFLPKERNHIENLADFIGVTVQGIRQMLCDMEKLGLITIKPIEKTGNLGYFPVMNGEHMIITDYLEDAMINSKVDEVTKTQILDMYGVKKKEKEKDEQNT
jgi:hypothetical protein